ncbi:DUF1361 domain-containing protein [Bacillus sp. HNG]|uniref:DUF1361 domain-containing protein n=1 Tax=Bacillus sp. HNG TaxID=2293325 RepID=UPI000E2FB30B|nr:DUF1361 domain-containing protein [Bacillus sp. HNG]RFB14880.1 DUF1361 domain-containing protein [Bacillus sp. HNG]
MGKFFEKYKGILLFMFVYWCICFVMLFKEASFLYVMLSWNVLLAVLPLFFVEKAEMTLEQRKIGWSIFWVILWLLFFPNSVYMVTDFIHISNDKFMWLIEVEMYSADTGVVYSNEIMVWVKLLVIGIGFFFAILVGLESFYIFEQNIREKYSMIICYLAILVVALLTGLGVYIGRFLRFNSWDILFSPMQLLKQVAGIDGFAVQFIITFTIYVIGSYTLYRTFKKQSVLRI